MKEFQKVIQSQFQKEPVWTILIGFAALMAIWWVIGPGGRGAMQASFRDFGRNPISTFQTLGAGFGLSLLALAGFLHFIPFTHEFGDRMLKGILKGAAVLFVAVPLGQGFVAHLGDIGHAITSLSASSPQGR